MALKDRTPTVRHPGPRCVVGKLLQRLPADDREVLAGWLDDRDLSAAAIERELVDDGHDVKQGSIAYHRRGGCRCGDGTG